MGVGWPGILFPLSVEAKTPRPGQADRQSFSLEKSSLELRL